MRSFFSIAFIVIMAGAAFVALNAIVIVDERQKALVMRFGEITRTIEKPGLNFKKPFLEEVIYIEDRLLFVKSPNKIVQVKDGKRYNVDAITMLRIVDPQKYRETVSADLETARLRIESRLDAALRQTYGRRDFSAALSKERAEMMREIRDQLKKEVSSLGIDIVDVKILRTDLREEVMEQAFKRMESERKAEAAQLRAVGEAEKQRIMAEADREATEIKAKAQREAEIVRGQGDAQRNKVFAEAFSKDPEFFAFYRSMQAYPKSLQGKDTTLVLTPDSEFFRYLRNPTGEAPKQ